MLRITPYEWSSMTSFALGTALGCLAIGYSVFTASPIPAGGNLLAHAVAFTPVIMLSLVVGRFVEGLRWLVPPSLIAGGVALPLDFVFANQLGWIGGTGLLLAIIGLSALAFAALRFLLDPRVIQRVFDTTKPTILLPSKRTSGATRS